MRDQLGDVADMVKRAGDLSLRWFRQENVAVEDKGEAVFDPVTVADKSVEDALRVSLQTLGPAEIYGEERGRTGVGESQFQWIIDPIDGTRAFITGQPMWGTLLGLLEDGIPIAGWMYLPVLNEMYEATPTASWVSSPQLGTRSLTASNCTRIQDATVLITHPSMFSGDQIEPYERLESDVKLSRYSGDCMNYALLATGSADLAVETTLMPYDIVPLLPILEAAGVVVTNLEGEAPLDGGFVIAAATPELHGAALAYFS